MKIAIKVLTEWDRENVIPFFEKHYIHCNAYNFTSNGVDKGELYLMINRRLQVKDEYNNADLDLSDYTILEGVPQDMELPKVDNPILGDNSSLSKQSYINGEPTKSREQELEECLKEICYQLTGEQRCEEELEKSLGIRLSSLVLQAKHLLNQK